MKLVQSAMLLHTVTAWLQLADFGSAAARPSGDAIVKALGPLLSEGTTVLSSSSAAAAPLLERSAYPRISPEYLAIVEARTENDVQQTIKYANWHHIPFLVVSGAHGWLTTLNRFHGGIQINMRKMNQTRLQQDGITANVGGGTLQHEITAALSAHDRRAVTGVCECVSAIGPLLGGGHSLLQARHGFAADNLISARVVLANGSLVTVSDKENADLFWGIRGAGHNFGVVTSFDVKTHPVLGRWTITTLVFTQDKLEAFFDTWNRLEDGYEDRGLLILFGRLARDDRFDRQHPVITLQISSEGNAPVIAEFTEAFRSLQPTAESTVKNLWLGEVHAIVVGPRSCDRNQNMMGFPSSFNRWDAPAMRRGFQAFSDLTADATFSASSWLLESYGNKGVRAVPEWENAVAPEERRYDILMAPTLSWQGDSDKDLARARWYGNRMQNVTKAKNMPHHSYLNYAQGHELLSEVYGMDKARIARLRRLKRQYDPLNRFGFYMPL